MRSFVCFSCQFRIEVHSYWTYFLSMVIWIWIRTLERLKLYDWRSCQLCKNWKVDLSLWNSSLSDFSLVFLSKSCSSVRCSLKCTIGRCIIKITSLDLVKGTDISQIINFQELKFFYSYREFDAVFLRLKAIALNTIRRVLGPEAFVVNELVRHYEADTNGGFFIVQQ